MSPVKKARSNPVYITPVLRQVYNSESSDELPEGDSEYTPASKKKRQRKRKAAATKNKNEDEIAVLQEKITPKTQLRLLQKKGNSKKKASSVQEMFKRLAEFSQSAKTTADESEDDSDLTCSVCQCSFWYKREVEEHVRTHHGMDRPEPDKEIKKE